MLLDNEISNHGKVTYDIDLVLLSSNSKEITQRIKQYVKEGEYKIQTGSTDQYQYYRFIEPKKENFAKEIELFASNENMLELDEKQRIIPIDPEEGLYSLSAIMLDKEYFDTFLAHLEQDIDSKMLKSIVDKLPVEKEQIIEILRRVFKS